MTITFTESKAVLDEMAAKINMASNRMAQAKALAVQADNELGSLPTSYAAFITDLNSLAVANPGDAAIQAQKAQKDRMVADFQDLKVLSATLRTAVGG